MTNATLAVRIDRAGIVDVDFISLFPPATFKGRKNGLRPDLAEKLAALKPAFLRFPGGCVLEHRDFRRWLDWKRTVGPLERRECEVGLWSWTQSYGLGYFECFQLCEDLHMAPVPVLIAGVTCQYRGPKYCPPEGIGFFTQNALDLIEPKFGSSVSTHLYCFNAEEQRNGVSNAYGPILNHLQLHPSGEATRNDNY